MILSRLSATNFMRFRELELGELPRRGLVGIVGENESGKTTIGAAIAFALFGRIADAGAPLASLIGWGEDFAEVELCFELPGRGRFRIFREIDRQGGHLAHLEDLERRNPAVTGAGSVARAVRLLLGYSFADFCQSFYLPQGAAALLARGGDLGQGLGTLSGAPLFARAEARAGKRAAELVSARDEVARSLEIAQIEAATFASERSAGEEALLSASIAESESAAAAAEAALAASEARISRNREERAGHEQIADSLERLAVAVRSAAVLAEVGWIEARLRGELEALPARRAQAVARTTAVRQRVVKLASLRDAIERLEQRVVARRDELERELVPSGSRQGLADQRFVASAAAARLAARGRAEIGLGLIAGSCGGVSAVLAGLRFLCLRFPSGLGLAAADYLPSHVPPAGALLILAGILLVVHGFRRRRSGRRAAESLRARVAGLDRQLEALDREYEFLGDADLKTLIRPGDGQLGEVADPMIREIVARIACSHSELVVDGLDLLRCAAEIDEEIVSADRRLRELDPLEERLARLLSRVAAHRRALGGLAGGAEAVGAGLVPPRPLCDGELASADVALLEVRAEDLRARGDDLLRRFADRGPSLAARLGALRLLFHECAAPLAARARLGAIEALLGALDGGREAADVGAQLEAALTALLAEFPGEEQLAGEERAAAVERGHWSGRLAEAARALEARKAEYEAKHPVFERRRQMAAEAARLEQRLAGLDAELAREKLALELIAGAALSVRCRIGPLVGQKLGIALDRVTGGRYSLASVGEDLRVRVFSEEKNAFVDPAELSGGTAEQLVLALRLAQAQVMLESSELAAPHFLFLDEPLAGVDRAATAGFLELLRESSGTFGQVLLAVTDHDLAAGLDFLLPVDRARTELRLRGLGAPGAAAAGSPPAGSPPASDPARDREREPVR